MKCKLVHRDETTISGFILLINSSIWKPFLFMDSLPMQSILYFLKWFIKNFIAANKMEIQHKFYNFRYISVFVSMLGKYPNINLKIIVQYFSSDDTNDTEKNTYELYHKRCYLLRQNSKQLLRLRILSEVYLRGEVNTFISCLNW